MKLKNNHNRIIIDSARTKPENWTDQDELIYHSYQILMTAIGKKNNLDISFNYDFTYELFKFYVFSVIEETMQKINADQDCEWFDASYPIAHDSIEYPKEQFIRAEIFGNPRFQIYPLDGCEKEETSYWKEKVKHEKEEERIRMELEEKMRKEIAEKLEHERLIEELELEKTRSQTIDLTKHSKFSKYK
tara:strand:- start:71 stop:637 length:567 start_codon:yes stop_codon:yes gene_type:complete